MERRVARGSRRPGRPLRSGRRLATRRAASLRRAGRQAGGPAARRRDRAAAKSARPAGSAARRRRRGVLSRRRRGGRADVTTSTASGAARPPAGRRASTVAWCATAAGADRAGHAREPPRRARGLTVGSPTAVRWAGDRVKICGITRLEDAELAVELGAWGLGFILWPGSKRPGDPAVAAGIARAPAPPRRDRRRVRQPDAGRGRRRGRRARAQPRAAARRRGAGVLRRGRAADRLPGHQGGPRRLAGPTCRRSSASTPTSTCSTRAVPGCGAARADVGLGAGRAAALRGPGDPLRRPDAGERRRRRSRRCSRGRSTSRPAPRPRPGSRTRRSCEAFLGRAATAPAAAGGA